jgi:hypothetical protein
MSVAKAKSVVRYCEARTRAGKLCKLPAGHGTRHVGRGRCSRHGGKTPNQEKKAAREAARDFLTGWNGIAMPVEPLDAAILAVELARGTVEHWREKLLDAYVKGDEPPPSTHESYRIALQDLARMTEAANRAGVADRMAALTERAVDQVTLAFEQASIAMKLDAATRAIGVKVFAEALRRAEGDEPRLLDAAR